MPCSNTTVLHNDVDHTIESIYRVPFISSYIVGASSQLSRRGFFYDFIVSESTLPEYEIEHLTVYINRNRIIFMIDENLVSKRLWLAEWKKLNPKIAEIIQFNSVFYQLRLKILFNIKKKYYEFNDSCKNINLFIKRTVKENIIRLKNIQLYFISPFNSRTEYNIRQEHYIYKNSILLEGQ